MGQEASASDVCLVQTFFSLYKFLPSLSRHSSGTASAAYRAAASPESSPYFPQCGAMTGGSGEAPPAPVRAAASPLQKPPGISRVRIPLLILPPVQPRPTSRPAACCRGPLLTVMILLSFPARFCETGQLIPGPDPLQGGQYGFRRLDRIGKLFFRMGGGHKHSLKLRRSRAMPFWSIPANTGHRPGDRCPWHRQRW